MPIKTIVILANSFKLGGRCVAGKVVKKNSAGNWDLSDEWIRPVSVDATSHGAVPTMRCWNRQQKRMYQPLDIVEIDFGAAVPEDGQPENWQLANDNDWVLHGTFNNDVLPQLLDRPDDIWLDTDSSINCVGSAARENGQVDSSLTLVEPEDLQFCLTYDFNPFKGKYQKKSEASFMYQGQLYNGIRVTDPYASSILGSQYPAQDGQAVKIALPNGSDYALCISLAPPFGGANAQYKLVAAIVPK